MRKRFRPPRRPNKVNAFLTDEHFAELERHAEANGETPGALASRVLANHFKPVPKSATAVSLVTAGEEQGAEL